MDTVAHWRPADLPPETPEGTTLPVIVARKSDKGKWYVFGAYYLNRVDLYDERDDETAPATGFHLDKRDDDYDPFYEAIDVLFWAPMPPPPDTLTP